MSLRSISAVTALSIAQLVVLFALQILLARYFGASAELDAYLAAQAVPLVLATVLTGSLSYVLVPVYNEQRHDHGEAAADAMLVSLGVVVLLTAAAVALLLFMFARPAVAILYADMPQAMTVSLLRILSLLLLLNVAINFFYGAYHARQRFLLPAWCGVAAPAVTVALIAAFPEWGIEGVAWATVIGGGVGVLLLAWRFPFRRIRENASGPSVLRRMFRLLWPLILGAAYYRLDPLIDRHLASHLPEGSISHLGYAWRLAMSISMIATSGLAVVAFPAIARAAAARDDERLAAELAASWRLLCVVLVPVFGALLAFSEPIIRDLFQRGAFTAADTEAVARLLVLYVGFIGAAGVGELAARAFYAGGDTRTPTLIGVFGFTLGTGAKFALTPVLEAPALAAATSGYYLLGAGLMVLILRRRIAGSIFRGLGGAFGRALAGTAAATAVGWLVVESPLPLGAVWGAIAGLFIYVAVLGLLGDEFARQLVTGIRGRSSRG